MNSGTSGLFPGERRSLNGLFCSSDSRLLYVDRTGGLQDYSYPLSGQYGITETRIGIRDQESMQWLDEAEVVSQEYLDDSALVQTTYDFGAFRLIQRDFTTGIFHNTSFKLQGGYTSASELIGVFSFSPEGQEGRVGQLVHGDVVEIYHDAEHDYLTSSNGFTDVIPQVPARFDKILSEDAQSLPRSLERDDYEESRLTGSTCVIAPIEEGTVTITNAVTDISVTDRRESLSEIRDVAASHASPSEIKAKACSESVPLPEHSDSVKTDLRVVDFLSADTGARIAGPDFDPFYQNSGGYGYTWFRDDSEIAMFLLEADRALKLDLEETHRRSAKFYVETQLDDGRWPHRVWPRNARLAPGWANGHIEGNDRSYQADQTASVLVYLANYLTRYRDRLPTGLKADIRGSLATGLDGLDESLAPDGLPTTCENAWENMNGRFTHTAACFLRAYSAIAAAPIDTRLREHARTQAKSVYNSLHQLWVDNERYFAMRMTDGNLDPRIDVSTVSLIDAHLAFREINDVENKRTEQLREHLVTVFDRLWKDTGEVRGLIRFEGDTWRRRSQESEKVWTVATGWGAYAAEKSISLLNGSENEYDPYEWSDRLFQEIDYGGSLCLSSGYLPEQFFDTGQPDSATPLGWPHAIRLATFALREIR
jgi:GH15 family glucan-1,4-alpha-glucosidase